jgi:hypothetical protein
VFNFLNFIRFNRNLKQYISALDALGDHDLTATDIVNLQEPLRAILSNAIRAGRVRTAVFAKDLDLSPKGATSLADVLVKKGLFRYVDGVTYDVRASGKTYGHEKPQTMQLWAKLDDKKKDEP